MADPARTGASRGRRGARRRSGPPLLRAPAAILLFAPGLIASVVPFAGGAAHAHPMGSFSINHYSRLTLTPDSIYVRQLLDLAEVPSFPVLAALDRNGDDLVEPHEKDAFLDSFVATLDTSVTCTLNRLHIKFQRTFANVHVRDGEGGLDQVVIGIDRAARIPEDAKGTLVLGHYRDATFPERDGWKEIAIETRGVTLVRTTVDPGDPTDGLTVYPEEFTRIPPNETEVRFTFGEGDLPSGGGAVHFPVPAVEERRLTTGRLVWIVLALAAAALAFRAGRMRP